MFVKPTAITALIMSFVGATIGPLPASAGAETADATAQAGVVEISWHDAADHYGERCAVYGTVVTAKNIGSHCFLNFDEDVRTSFTVVINDEDFGKFPEPPEVAYLNKTIRVTGEVVKYRDKPEIVVRALDDITLVQPGDVPAAAHSATTTTQPASGSSSPESASGDAAPKYKTPTDGRVRVATYNVLNLFDDYDDPYIENENLPGKPETERAHLSETIHKIDADVLALEEVESRPVLQSFVDQFLGDLGYCEVVLIEGNNPRGIDVGLLSRFPVGPVTSHRHLRFRDANGAPMRFQRDLLQVRIEPAGCAPFDMYVVHLKSKYGGEAATLPTRLGEARAVRGVLDERLRQTPTALFLLAGDFNDTLDSAPLKELIGQGDRALHTFIDDIPSDQRTTYNKRPLSMIDFLFASPGMAARYVSGSETILHGTVDTGGSDHNPVVAVFKLPPGDSTN